MDKEYYEVQIKVYLLNNIQCLDCNERLARFINYSMNSSPILKGIHMKTGFKHYSFCTLYPIEKDSIYKADEIYSFMIRTYKKNLMNEFIKSFENLSNEDFIVTEVNLRKWNHKQIEYCDCITPCTVTMEDRSFLINKDDIEDFKIKVFNNMIKKYNDFNGINMKINYDDVIEDIIIKNQCPIIIHYKKIKILGNKARVIFKQNELSQELANFMVVEGIAEKNSSLGLGFVKPYFKKKVIAQ